MSLRLAVTADLHHDVPRSGASAEALANEANQTRADAVLLIGDAAAGEGDALERCLSLFEDGRPRLFVPGNHELWTRRRPIDAEHLLQNELPRRVRAAGWHWLPGSPWTCGDVAVVGNLGWYDYGFAAPQLGLPERFYAAKVSPAAARRLDLPLDGSDVPPAARDFFARWNDGRFIHGINDDAAFLARRLDELRADLSGVAAARRVICAVHCCPLAELLPPVPPGPVPADKLKFAFARAYLGSPRLGEIALGVPNVSHLLCGHTHVPRHATVHGVQCVNVGGGYTDKKLLVLDVDPEDSPQIV